MQSKYIRNDKSNVANSRSLAIFIAAKEKNPGYMHLNELHSTRKTLNMNM